MPNVFVRGWRYFIALLQGKLDQWEDPEIILNESMRQMKENQVKNRELAVQAITAKNNLQAEVDRLERTSAELERKATMLLGAGNRDGAKELLKQKAINDQTLVSMRTNLMSANEASEKVKTAIRQEEERFRQRTAEALALKANMKTAQIQIQINKALDQFQFSDTENGFASVKDRITTMQSEANARAEVGATSLDAKLREIEVGQMDVEADRMLAELEMKQANPAANYNTAPQTQYQTVGGNGAASSSNGASTPNAPESDIDRQLRELEEKLGKK